MYEEEEEEGEGGEGNENSHGLRVDVWSSKRSLWLALLSDTPSSHWTPGEKHNKAQVIT